jgi:hypothetical protein
MPLWGRALYFNGASRSLERLQTKREILQKRTADSGPLGKGILSAREGLLYITQKLISDGPKRNGLIGRKLSEEERMQIIEYLKTL